MSILGNILWFICGGLLSGLSWVLDVYKRQVLDCGCGTGAMLVMFRDACPDKQYTGKERYGINKFSFVLSKV